MITQRGVVSLVLLAFGFVLMLASYFGLAAPWGFPPDAVRYSNPRLEFAPALFVLGVILAFLSAVGYEPWPERDGRGRCTRPGGPPGPRAAGPVPPAGGGVPAPAGASPRRPASGSRSA